MFLKLFVPMNRRNMYSIPDLATKEIVSYFAELGISISPADILKPSAVVVQAIYDAILELFEGLSIPDGDESLQVIRQVQQMGNFLDKVGINNFTIRDLSPDSRRFIQILSTICNFGMFRDNKRHVYEQASKIADDNFVIKKSLDSQLSSIKADIEGIQNSLKDNAKMKETLEGEISTLEDELKEFYRYQREKMSEVSLLKTEKIEIGDKLCSCQLLEHNLRQEITCLRTQIVSDPTKLLELVEEMRSLIEREKESVKLVEKAIQNQNARLSRISRVDEQVQVLYRLGNELTAAEDKIEKYEQGIAMAESKLKNWDSSINASKIRINHIERQISHLESKIYNLQSKDRKVSEEISSKISSLQAKYDAVNSERELMLEKIRNNNRMVQDVMFERAKREGEHERECSDIAGLFVSLNGGIDSYFSELRGLVDQ